MNLINVPALYTELKNTLSLGQLIYKTEQKAAFEAYLSIELFFAFLDKDNLLHLEVGTSAAPTAFATTKASHLFVKFEKDYYYTTVKSLKEFARDNRDKLAFYFENDKRFVIYKFSDIKHLLIKL